MVTWDRTPLRKPSHVSYTNVGGNFNFMKRLVIILVLSLVIMTSKSQDSKFPSGLIYGQLAAYQISAVDDWVLDNKAGLGAGLHCVLYLKNSTWEQSSVIMYGKIASTNFKTVKEFTDFAYTEFKKEDSNFKRERLADVKIDEAYKAIIYKYVGGPYNSYEGAAYVQVDNAVCYVVFSARNENDYNKYAESLIRIIKTFKYRRDFIGHKEN